LLLFFSSLIIKNKQLLDDHKDGCGIEKGGSVKKWVVIYAFLFGLVFVIQICMGLWIKSLMWDIKYTRQIAEDTDKFQTSLIDWIAFVERKIPDYEIDFSVSTIQGIDAGFKVAGLNVEKHLTGVKIKGRIINSTALTYKDITFKMIVGEQEKDFYIKRISSGNSSSFEIYVPDVPIEAARFGEIKRGKSLVEYRYR